MDRTIDAIFRIINGIDSQANPCKYSTRMSNKTTVAFRVSNVNAKKQVNNTHRDWNWLLVTKGSTFVKKGFSCDPIRSKMMTG